MGLLYCGANIQPTAAAEVCDDGRSLYNTEGGIFRTQCSILRDYQPVWLLCNLRFVILGTFGFFWGGTFPLPVILDIFSSGIKKLWKIKGFLVRLSGRAQACSTVHSLSLQRSLPSPPGLNHQATSPAEWTEGHDEIWLDDCCCLSFSATDHPVKPFLAYL